MDLQFTTPTNEAMNAFIESFKKPHPDLTVSELIKKNKHSNHEIWRQCECGAYNDLKMRTTCEDCGAKLKP